MNAKTIYLILLTLLICYGVSSQTLPVGLAAGEDYLRRAQLVGRCDSSISFSVRPLFSLEYLAQNISGDSTAKSISLKKISVPIIDSLVIMPFSVLTQFNSHHPTGWNEGSLIPNKGVQTKVSGGVFFERKRLSFQLMPEFVFSQNDSFEEFNVEHFPVVWQRMYQWWNTIDEPVRFGSKSLFRFYPGQSSIRYNFDNISIGISSENLWWGPGKRNSLIMSNNAPGFYHLVANTRKPVTTSIGSFEGQFVAGTLTNSGFTPPAPERKYLGTQLYHPSTDKWRYLSGMTVSWQPKWVSGLFLGYSITSQVYLDEIGGIRDIQPFFNGIKQAGIQPNPKLTNNQQQSSGYLRWLLQESNAEFYIEYGTNGRSRGLREFLVQPNRHRAFTIGLSKIYPIKKNRFIQFDAEITQLGQVVREVVRDGDSWYTDKYIRQGYTNQGQVIGAGIGPGSNVFYAEASWWSGVRKIGVFAERLVHNNDFYYYTFEESKDWRRFWTDLSTGLLFDWTFKNCLISSSVRYSRSLNYQWYLFQKPGESYFVNGLDVNNLSASLSLVYFLK